MRVFLTGATGFIGSRIVPELISAGHQVLGLTRSDAGVEALRAAGAEPHRGDIYDLDTIRSGAAAADAVIHTAFNHDFSTFAENCETDRKVVEAIGSVLKGSDRRLVTTSGTAIAISAPGQPSTETSPTLTSAQMPRAKSEESARAVAELGVHTSIVRLPQVHDTVKQGLITYLVQVAREKGKAAYVGEGQNRWCAAPVDSVAQLYRLVLEKGRSGANYNAIAEEGVRVRDITEVIGRGLNVPMVSITPEEALAHFGWLSMFVGHDIPASSAITQAELGWKPTGPSLLTDLANMKY